SKCCFLETLVGSPLHGDFLLMDWKVAAGCTAMLCVASPTLVLLNRPIMDTGDAHPMNIDEESDDSVEEIGNPTQLGCLMMPFRF
ncbi:hypothetical protein Tco_0862087, partial [Tanacetum coccineum]